MPCPCPACRARAELGETYRADLCDDDGRGLTLDDLEQLAARLNAASEDGPRVYLDDRDLYRSVGGRAWFDMLSTRLEIAIWIRDTREVLRARGML